MSHGDVDAWLVVDLGALKSYRKFAIWALDRPKIDPFTIIAAWFVGSSEAGRRKSGFWL